MSKFNWGNGRGTKIETLPVEEPNGKWFKTITLFPKECALTGKPIPMYTTAYLRKDGQLETWVGAEDFIIARLKGEI